MRVRFDPQGTRILNRLDFVSSERQHFFDSSLQVPDNVTVKFDKKITLKAYHYLA